MLDDFPIRAVIAGIGVALIAAPLGCFVVWRRMAYFGAAIAHSGLLGVAAGLLLAIDPFIGVIAVTLGVAAILTLLRHSAALPSDTILGVLAHVALAGGLIAASALGSNEFDLMDTMFGDILSVNDSDLLWIYGGGAVILTVTAWIWRPLLAISVHEELARAEGVNAARIHALFMVLLAFTVALAMKLVGILLIASLLIIPAATARPFSSTPERMAVIAAVIASFGVVGGIAASFWLGTPAGPTIVIALTLIFILSFIGGSLGSRR